jgi:hypothetical protein
MDQEPRKRRRAWLEKQSQQQAHGTYLIRPFRPMPIIYEVDAETNDRWISYQIAFCKFAWIWFVAFVLVGTQWGWGLLACCAVYLLAAYGWPLILIHGAHRVPGSRWTGAAVVDRAGRYSRTTWAIWLVVSLMLTALMTYIGLSGRYGPIRGDMVGLIVLFMVCGIIFAVRLFRS